MDQQQTYPLTKILSYVLLLFVSFNLLASDKFILPPDHSSFYRIEKLGMHVGDMHNQLNYNNNTITYTSKATARGMATMFISSDPLETSHVNWPENKPDSRPQQIDYEYIQGKKHKKNQNFIFDWDTEGEVNISGIYKKKSYSIKSDGMPWSRQLLPLLMSNDLQNNPLITGNSFLITNKGTFKKYFYTLESNEQLEFDNKKFDVLKFKISKRDSKRVTYAWLSKAHYYLPLKLEQYKNDELNVRMLMSKLKIQ